MEGVQKIQGVHALKSTCVLRFFLLLLLFGIFLGGCANTYPKVTPSAKVVALMHLHTEIPDEELLDMQIVIFDPGELPSSENASRGLSEEIREAEAHYIPVQLKNTIQQTGFWGAVRVGPEASAGDEVLVSGRILESNGEELKLEIEASDATGKRWFKEKFEGVVDVEMYKESKEKQHEVFQNVYNQIANKLIEYRQKMTSEQAREIRRVAEMRFAEALAPNAFSGYLKKDEKKGRVNIDRLPSEEDEMFIQVRRVRERDYMLTDTLDAYYEGLHRDMSEIYMNWRKTRLDEMDMIREVDAKKNMERAKGVGLILAGAALGALGGNVGGYSPAIGTVMGAAVGAGIGMMMRAERIAEESEINKAALEELGVSFEAEVEPIVIEVEGETIELTGSAKEKYQQWRQALARLYQLETGETTIDASTDQTDDEVQPPPQENHTIPINQLDQYDH